MLEPIGAPLASSHAHVEPDDAISVDEAPPYPIGELSRPVYPPEALAAHSGEVVVYVTITIGAKGDVSEAIPSWGRINIPNRYSEQFLDAVRACVARWKFQPARLVYWQNGGEQGRRYLYAETIPSKTDIKFTFTAAGDVR